VSAVAPRSTFASWLRARRTAYGTLLVACALGASAAAGGVQWLRGVAPVEGEALFWQRPWMFGWLHAHAGLSLSMQLWLLPVGFVLSVALLLVLSESILYASRVDRADHAWSSVAWSFRGWRANLVWCLAAGLVLAAAAGVTWLFERAFPDVGRQLDFDVLDLPVASLISFFAWNAANLGKSTPPTWWPPRWPGLGTLLLAAAWIAIIFGLDSALESFGIDPITNGPWSSRAVYIVALLLAGYVAESTVLVAWLNRSRLPMLNVFGLACRWRVLGPTILQDLRLVAWVALVLLPLVPMWLLLVHILPSVEEGITPFGWDLPRRWSTAVAASRFAVSYWWALVIGMVVLSKFVLTWPGVVAKGRLFVELGLVQTPSTDESQAEPIDVEVSEDHG